jgi:two-component system sensor histidine kinase BaeS
VVARLAAAFFLALFACGASLLLFQSLATEVNAITYLTLAGVAILLFIGLAAAVRGGRWLQGMISPIDDLLATTEQLAAGDYQARAPLKGIPELRRLSSAINGMAGQLEQTAAARQGFFANVTHELRTPLTIIQGEVEGMIDGVHPPDEERLGSILEETRHLSRLVEDLRTLSLAEAGALELRLEPTQLADFLHEVAASFKLEAERAGVRLEIQAQSEAPPALVDPRRLREVLANLIINGINASQAGDQISLAYNFQEGTHHLAVADEGAGITDEDLPAIFDRFTKSSESEGTGLGLAIAKELVEAHGGTIEVESQAGIGTVMKVELPGVESKVQSLESRV